MRHPGVGQDRSQGRGVPADQLGMGDPREQRAQRFDRAGLGLAAGDPHQPVVAGQRPRRRIGVGRLAVVDPGHAIHHGHLLLPVRQPGKACDPPSNRLPPDPKRQRQRRRRRRVLRVVPAGQGRGVRHRQDRPGGVAQHRPIAPDIRPLMARHRCPATPQRGAVRIVNADHGGIPGALPVEDMRLRRGIARHVAMPVQVVRADVQQRRRIEAQGLQPLQHVGRHLKHIHAVVAEQRQGQRRRTQVAARRIRPACNRQDMRQQRRRRALAVGAGHAHEPRP